MRAEASVVMQRTLFAEDRAFERAASPSTPAPRAIDYQMLALLVHTVSAFKWGGEGGQIMIWSGLRVRVRQVEWS